MDGMDALPRLLNLALESPEEAEAALAGLEGPGIHAVRFPPGEYPAHTGQPVHKVLIQLSGRVTVLKFSQQGGVVRSDGMGPPQIYGLYELLNNIEEHTATLQAEGPVLCASVSPELYRQNLLSSHTAVLCSLRFLAGFTARMLDENDKLSLNTPRHNLLAYLYNACAGREFPVTIRQNKALLAERLCLNLRSLYRYLDKLETEGCLRREGGKIVVDSAAHRKIADRLNRETGQDVY